MDNNRRIAKANRYLEDGGIDKLLAAAETAMQAGYSEIWTRTDTAVAAFRMAMRPASFQSRVAGWMASCFSEEIAADRVERCDRFIEEALELVQACGYSADRAHAIVDYVFSRPDGRAPQEVGGVMVTLAALCNVFKITILDEAETELARLRAAGTFNEGLDLAEKWHDALADMHERDPPPAVIVDVEARIRWHRGAAASIRSYRRPEAVENTEEQGDPQPTA